MKYYIADTHFGHENILKLDNRPWDNLEDMEADMISRWNSRVTDSDDVYILGDFCWHSKAHWIRLLTTLKGRKHIVLGNHDLKEFPQKILELLADEPQKLLGVIDGGHHVVLCHYPILAYWHDNQQDSVMLYGHVHNTVEDEAVRAGVAATKEYIKENKPDYVYCGNLHNVWCGYYDYAPATLEEILKNNY